MTTDTKQPVDRVKFPKTIFVSYSWSNGTQSGFGNVNLDVTNGFETPKGLSEVRKHINDKHHPGGTVVLIFWRELGSDAEEPIPT